MKKLVSGLLFASFSLMAAETWRVEELSFASSQPAPAWDDGRITLDVVFSNRTSGAMLARPAFWDGGQTWRVRFAPPAAGTWDWRTHCTGDAALDGRTGALEVTPYSGPLAIYRHGFVKTVPGKKYFTYADGTPFLYLGDTHWGMYKEEFDAPGPHAGATGCASHFRYVVDRRVQQGFTVYQSEPIDAPFDVRDGRVDAVDIAGFREADRYYRHLADAGLVHANAEFFFCSAMSQKLAADDAALKRLCRYWVARFGAYPVMWTLAQECDNDFYLERKANYNFYSATNNPWSKVAEYLHAADGYGHPLSGHQENTGATTVTGAGTHAKNKADGASAFRDPALAARCGHTWWAAQWSPSITGENDAAAPRDYWQSPRPAVNYEGRYCCLWTKDYGARAQGWISFLSGFCGYGYGAIDMWLYKSSYDIKKSSNDGRDTITVADKLKPWSEAIEFPSANQMIHLKKFLGSFDWWNLVPDFSRSTFWELREPIRVHATAGRRHVWYFYGNSRKTPPATGLEPHTLYRLRWFNPRTGEWLQEQIVHPEDNGRFALPPRPDTEDWALELVPAGSVTLAAGRPLVIDFGAEGAGGYPALSVLSRSVEAQGARLRVSYSTHPDGLGEKGDFWRETSARYLGPDVDLPILPGNIDRYEFFTLASNGTYRASLLQGLVRYARLALEAPSGTVTIGSFDLVNDRVHAAGEREGRFDCSDPGLAAIWEASVRTCELSAIPSYDSVWGAKKGITFPYLADGAKRDRLVWSGDLWWAERSWFCGFRPSAPYMRGSIDLLAANQTPEGYVQASPWPDQPAPQAGEWGPFGSDEFACWFVPVLWDYYFNTADRATVVRQYPVLRKLMAYLAKYQDPATGIFQQRKETCKHAAGLVFGGTSLHHRSYMNILLWKTYEDAAALAEAAGERRDAGVWKAAAAKLAPAIRAAFWNGEKGWFRLSAEQDVMGFEANALALATRFATEEEAARMQSQLVRTGHGKFQALMARGKFEYGAADAAIRAIDAHGWRKVFDPDWQGLHLTSECMGLIRKGWGDEAHPDTAIAGMLTNYILGIRPREPGYAAFDFALPVTRRISWASGCVPTPHGAISCSWLRAKDGWEIHVNVPPGTRCRVRAPGEDPVDIGPGTFTRTF